MNLLRKFFHLPPREKYLFFKTVFLLASYRIQLKTTPLQKVLRCVTSDSQKILQVTTYQSIAPKRLATIIIGASRIVPCTTCLSQALTGKRVFAEHGYKTQLHIGVHRDITVTFKAHAWLSLGDDILLGYRSNLYQYKEFSSPFAPKEIL